MRPSVIAKSWHFSSSPGFNLIHSSIVISAAADDNEEYELCGSIRVV